MITTLKTVPYHKLCAYNPKTDSTLWLKNYRVRGGELTLWFVSDPHECALLVVDLNAVVQEFLGMDYELMRWDLETLKECNWL
jgi:hypothetical protein